MSLPREHQTRPLGSNYIRGLAWRRFGINKLMLVSLTFVSWNQLSLWLRQLAGLRRIG